MAFDLNKQFLEGVNMISNLKQMQSQELAREREYQMSLEQARIQAEQRKLQNRPLVPQGEDGYTKDQMKNYIDTYFASNSQFFESPTKTKNALLKYAEDPNTTKNDIDNAIRNFKLTEPTKTNALNAQANSGTVYTKMKDIQKYLNTVLLYRTLANSVEKAKNIIYRADGNPKTDITNLLQSLISSMGEAPPKAIFEKLATYPQLQVLKEPIISVAINRARELAPVSDADVRALMGSVFNPNTSYQDAMTRFYEKINTNLREAKVLIDTLNTKATSVNYSVLIERYQEIANENYNGGGISERDIKVNDGVGNEKTN